MKDGFGWFWTGSLSNCIFGIATIHPKPSWEVHVQPFSESKLQASDESLRLHPLIQSYANKNKGPREPGGSVGNIHGRAALAAACFRNACFRVGSRGSDRRAWWDKPEKDDHLLLVPVQNIPAAMHHMRGFKGSPCAPVLSSVRVHKWLADCEVRCGSELGFVPWVSHRVGICISNRCMALHGMGSSLEPDSRALGLSGTAWVEHLPSRASKSFRTYFLSRWKEERGRTRMGTEPIRGWSGAC